MVLSLDITIPRDQLVISFFWYEHIEVSYHPAKFGGNKHSSKGDIMTFVCHMTLKDFVIKTLYDFIDRVTQDKSPSYQASWP